MINAKSQILSGIRRSLGRRRLDRGSRLGLQKRLDRHARNVIPARSKKGPNSNAKLFISKAIDVSATIAEIGDIKDVPKSVAAYLARHNLPARVVQSPSVEELNLRWNEVPAMLIRCGTANKHDDVSVTLALSGVAETGTLVLASSPNDPTTLNFLPQTNIVVLYRDRIVGAYEDAWDEVRSMSVKAGRLPRMINLITGPSRTGDIEQKIELGVHGPLKLHIIIVDKN